jgi:WD40 repeat protein
MFVLVVALVLSLTWWATWRMQQSSVPRRGTLRKPAATAAGDAPPKVSDTDRAADSELAFLYDGFISYRHVTRDRRWARWLHHTLESYRTPAELVARGVLPRTGRIFRDEEELSATGDLPDSIKNALANSNYLFVVCSPAATESKWIDAEIKMFRAQGRGHHILPVIVEGTTATALPPSLRSPAGASIEGPLVITLPSGLLTRRARQTNLLRLLAPLLRCGFEDLRDRDRRRARIRARRTAIAATAVAIVVGLLLWRSENSFIHDLAVHSKNTRNIDSSLSLLLSREGFARAVRLRRWFGQNPSESRSALEADIVTSRLRGVLKMPGRSVQSVAWTRDDKIAASDYDGYVYVWQRTTGVRIASHHFEEGIQHFVERPGGGDLTLALVTGGATRLSGGALLLGNNAHRKLYVWNTVTDAVQFVQIPDNHITQSADLSWCGDHLAVAVGSPFLFLFRLPPLQLERQVEGKDLFKEDWEEVNTVAWHANCSSLAVGTGAGLYLLTANEARHTRLGRFRRGSDNEVSGVISVDWLGPDTIAAGARDRTASVWTLSRGQEDNPEVPPSPPVLETIGGHAAAVTVIRHGPRERLATGSADGTVRIWRRADFGIYEAVAFFYPYQAARVNGLAWSPGGDEVATAGEDHTVRIWNIRIDSNVTLGGESGSLSLGNDEALLFRNRPLTDQELIELGRQRTFRQLSSEECQTYLRALWRPWCPVI